MTKSGLSKVIFGVTISTVAGLVYYCYRRFIANQSEESPEDEDDLRPENVNNVAGKTQNNTSDKNTIIVDNEDSTGPALPGEHLVMLKRENPEVAVNLVLQAAEKELQQSEDRKNGGGDNNKQNSHTKQEETNGSTNNSGSNKTIIQELIIPKEIVAGLIGKKGYNIKGIQHNSNTRINFKEQTLENGDRICLIRGRPDDVNLAGDMIKKFIATQPVTITKNLLVPYNTVGRIIGRSGETIRSIQDMSKAKVTVESNRHAADDFSEDGEALNLVIVKGTQEQIDLAEGLILEKVEEEKAFRSKIKGVASTRTARRVNAGGSPSSKNASSSDALALPKEQKQTLRTEGISEVFVSCVYHPNSFWLQQVGRDSIELDKLGENMTEYYSKETASSQLQTDSDRPEFQAGDVVAAPFQMDNKMYRAKVIHVSDDGKTAEVEYVDYGDRREVQIFELRTLLPSFLDLKFQAIHASLNLTMNAGETKWTDDTITRFCDLSYCAQWQSITAKVKGFLTDESQEDDVGKSKTVIWVELMDKDLNLGEQLIRDNLAAGINTSTNNTNTT